LGNAIVPTALIVNILVLLLLIVTGLTIFLAVRYRRLRRQLAGSFPRPDILHPIQGQEHKTDDWQPPDSEP
jgi:hypothetical protein